MTGVLTKFFTLDCIKEIKQKNMSDIHVLVSLAVSEGDFMLES